VVCGEVVDIIEGMLRRAEKMVCICRGDWGFYSDPEGKNWLTDLQLC
jgi:hypothetical protein